MRVGALSISGRGTLIASRLLKAGRLALAFSALLTLLPKAAAQLDNPVSEEQKEEEAKNRFKSMKTHFGRGNQAMQDAQAIRQQLQIAGYEPKPALVAQMKANYQTAITEYQQALQNTDVRDENGVRIIGLIGVIRNGLVSQEMLVQNANLPVILTNLGFAYGGAGEYQEAINMLQHAAIVKPVAGTYMELGTDLAQMGKKSEAMATCDKIPTAEPAAKDMQERCYKNVAIVLIDKGKLADAVGPLEKATQLNPQDALAWKLLGDALSSTITSKSERGETVYVVPQGTVDAYQKYVQLQPNGSYAEQVKIALDSLAQLNQVSISKEKN